MMIIIFFGDREILCKCNTNHEKCKLIIDTIH